LKKGEVAPLMRYAKEIYIIQLIIQFIKGREKPK
jgi:hypothetical protein